jgi:nicotinate-nucleotide adenylyltransferase
LGWDNISELPRWKEPDKIIGLCKLVAFPRPGASLPDLDAINKMIPGLTERVILMERPFIDISATKIRERVAKGLDISQMVPKAVAAYIKQNKLYKAKPVRKKVRK